MVDLPLPTDFDVSAETAHLDSLWSTSPDLQEYEFQAFVHAGGSGMVFKVSPVTETDVLALKVVREKLYTGKVTHPDAAKSLSPVSPEELRALRRLSHPNIVRLNKALADHTGVYAITTSFVDNPKPLDLFLVETLERDPDPKGVKGLSPFAPERLDRACAFLVERFLEISDALSHMHEQQLFHCDLKPANVLIDARQTAIITDLGSCVHPDDAIDGQVRVQFTWTYAHPMLTSLISDPKGISGGGLKASASISLEDGLARLDLFALGRTIQETLAHLETEFGERCYAAYNFRFLHLCAALLLDGHNAPLADKARVQDGRRFIRDVALDYPVDVFHTERLTAAVELRERLRRFSRSYWPSDGLPELDPWQPDIINTGIWTAAPFSPRVAAVFRHPAVRRLRSELQLGWVREVYPGATHTRWSHSLGVFAATAEYYAALLADPDVPTARILLDPTDVEHALVAALLHDIGQTAFGHDIEGAAPHLYNHQELVAHILDDKAFGLPTLRDVIARQWPRVSISRVLDILRVPGERKRPPADVGVRHPVDGIAEDIVNGPIDADKLDYLERDAASCGVPYGLGIDRARFLRALTVDAKGAPGGSRFALAYRAKGAAAVESLLLARYQMYRAVYWHHSFRCIQAMFSHAVASTVPDASTLRLGSSQVSLATVRTMFYYRVVCGHTWERCKDLLKGRFPKSLVVGSPVELRGEKALEFVWVFADASVRRLVERLARRELYRRVFELSVGDLRELGDYSKIAAQLAVVERRRLSEQLTDRFLDSIYRQIQQRRAGPESTTESRARDLHQRLHEKEFPMLVIDFPVRGVSDERNFPRAIGDPARKYIAGKVGDRAAGRSVFHAVRDLQVRSASVRIFAARELHELIVRYLDPEDVQDCVESVLPVLRQER